ncbi:MAG: extracellular solute-binding protein, partial [Clostridia bacterium]|nr:extracellular solute-binding protein [Clostridia bacterium]
MALTGCSRQPPDAPETDLLPGTAAVQSGILTNIFKAEEFPLPDGYSLSSWMEPLKDDGTIAVGAADPDGNRLILTLDGSGNIANTLPLPLSAENAWLSEGAYFGGTAAYITNYSTDTRKAVFQLHATRSGDTEPYVIPDLAQFYADDDGMESYRVAVDGEGYLWLACTRDKVFVLTPDLQKAGTVALPGLIRDITTDRDGKILVLTGAEQDSLIHTLDRQSLSVSREIRLKGTSADGLFRCSGYDFCYSDDTGVKGYNAETDTSVLLMDYQNSNTSSADFTVCGVTDSDTIIGVRKNPLTNRSLLSLFRRSDDVDLSGVVTVEIAAVEPDNYIASQITAFNEENPGIRVILHDYSVYSNQENPDGGNQKLTIDILNGLLEPDLVYGRPFQSYMAELAENGLYTDLCPLFEKDEDLSADDLYR